MEVRGDSPHRGKLKDAISLVGSKPMFTHGLLALAKWMTEYYIIPRHQVLRTMLPQVVRVKPETFLKESRLSLVSMPPPDVWEKMLKTAPMQARVLDAVKAAGGEITLRARRKRRQS